MRGPIVIVIGALLAASMNAVASEYAPRVLSSHQPDTYSLKTFAAFPSWRDLRGDAKLWAIFAYLADTRTGIYPMGVPAWEGPEEMPEFAVVRDPIKMLNVYPIGHCGTLGPTAAGLLEGIGLGPARTLILPGLNHVAAEVWYEGRWHYVDLDLRAVFRRADGSLASLEEARTEVSLWRGPNTPLFFPLDNLEQTRQACVATRVEHVHGFQSGGHTMAYVLRRGEAFTRWWRPQGGRWNHHPSYAARPFPRRLLEQEPRGPKCKHASFTVHTHGNGRFIYAPNLTRRSQDFADGVYDADNVQPGGDGLTLQRPGRGYAIFEVRSPYVIVPRVGELDDPGDDAEASVVTVEASEATCALSVDNGLSWKELAPAAGAHDLTRYVSGSYGYLLRLTLNGEPGQAVVRSLRIVTWVQVHPASLPALRKGANPMRYVTGDHYGRPTRVVEVRPQAGRREEFLKCLEAPPADFDAARRTARARGAFITKVSAPPGARICWFSGGGSFATHQGDAAPNTKNSMAYAVEEPRDFRLFYEAAVPAGNAHWHYNADVEVTLPAPAKTLYVRYVGDPAVNAVRIYAHCLEDRPRASAPVTITHTWREQGRLKSQRVTLAGPAAYEIRTEDDPEDESIELALPSNAAQ